MKQEREPEITGGDAAMPQVGEAKPMDDKRTTQRTSHAASASKPTFVTLSGFVAAVESCTSSRRCDGIGWQGRCFGTRV
jgi:hypothetical protein